MGVSCKEIDFRFLIFESFLKRSVELFGSSLFVLFIGLFFELSVFLNELSRLGSLG